MVLLLVYKHDIMSVKVCQLSHFKIHPKVAPEFTANLQSTYEFFDSTTGTPRTANRYSTDLLETNSLIK